MTECRFVSSQLLVCCSLIKVNLITTVRCFFSVLELMAFRVFSPYHYLCKVPFLPSRSELNNACNQAPPSYTRLTLVLLWGRCKLGLESRETSPWSIALRCHLPAIVAEMGAGCCDDQEAELALS